MDAGRLCKEESWIVYSIEYITCSCKMNTIFPAKTSTGICERQSKAMSRQPKERKNESIETDRMTSKFVRFQENPHIRTKHHLSTIHTRSTNIVTPGNAAVPENVAAAAFLIETVMSFLSTLPHRSKCFCDTFSRLSMALLCSLLFTLLSSSVIQATPTPPTILLQITTFLPTGLAISTFLS